MSDFEVATVVDVRLGHGAIPPVLGVLARQLPLHARHPGALLPVVVVVLNVNAKNGPCVVRPHRTPLVPHIVLNGPVVIVDDRFPGLRGTVMLFSH